MHNRPHSATPAEPVVMPPMDDALREEKTALLETVFERIYRERMHDVPITNDKIGVHAIGMQRWENTYLCVLVTPWFMNLMLLPDEKTDWDDLQETSSVRHTFPSGRYEFLVGYEPDIGKYQMCSLFSPMFEFSDDDAAVETASVAINELMNVENVEETDIDSQQIANIWNGVEPHPDKVANADTDNTQHKATSKKPRRSLKEKMEQPISRRQLLRGAVSEEEDKA